MEIKNTANNTAEFTIFGDIVSDEWGKWTDDDTCPSDVKKFFDSLDESVDNINVHINSGGGSVYGGIAIYNLLKNHKAHVTVHVDGIAASIASVIACAGDKVIIPSNATFMIHKPSNSYFFTSLNADELRKDADTLDICQKTILNTYMTKVKDGITEDEINDKINAETWLVGNEVTELFDFELEEQNSAVACASTMYNEYKNTPNTLKEHSKEQNNTKENSIDVDEVVNKVLELLDKREQDKLKTEKHDLLNDLDKFGK